MVGHFLLYCFMPLLLYGQCHAVPAGKKFATASYSVCSVTGDPHYLTFDGRRFDFQGTGLFQMVGVCSEDPNLVPFDVLVQNNIQGSKVVFNAKLVEVKVYNLSIVISKENPGTIMVNNELTLLPIYLTRGKISVHKSGWNAVVKTDFNLTVSFDWNAAVSVTLPSTYVGAVCGLCGNYNNKPQDDLTMKNGQATVIPEEFGITWCIPGTIGCVQSCEGGCPNCDLSQKQEYETGAFCGLINDPSGPFRDCHKVVDPSNYFNNCIYDLCHYNGLQYVLCQAITTYTTACQESGAKVYSWRSSNLCNAECPANSHYELCATGCPATCYTMSIPFDCIALCKEDCICNDGFILSGDHCVPVSQCGCVYKSTYYNIADTFSPNGTCLEQCTCIKEGKIECKPFSCGQNEKCELVNGTHTCQPAGSGVCSASGDPHYKTFDGLPYDFQGTCTYVLAKGCDLEGTHLIPFSVMVENEKWWPEVENKNVSVPKLVALEVYNYTLILQNNMLGVLVNGVFNYLPLNLSNDAVVAYLEGFNYVLKTNFGLVVTYDHVYHVSVIVPGDYHGKTCGLCGNFNGNKNDDLHLPNGTFTKNINDFGLAWKVAIPDVVCDDGCSGNTCPDCAPALKTIYGAPGYCGILTAPDGPFTACYSKLDPTLYFNDCVYDICASYGNREVLCDTIAAYVYNCQLAGVEIKNWRTPYFCPVSCPANSHYEICVSSCSLGCPGLNGIVTCPSTCTEGCSCNPGFLFNGQNCVAPEKCSCYNNGHTYKPGDVVYVDDCQVKCVCKALEGLVCEPYSCPIDTKCLVQKGVKACYHIDPCKNANCRVKETCKVQKGEAVCIPDYTGTCWGWGDPHYHTFDGYDYNFQGTCTYTLSKTCGNLTGLVPFSIVERNDNRGTTVVSYVRDVEVFVYGYNITMIKYQNGRILVNNETNNLPVYLKHGQLTVTYTGSTAVLTTDFGLYVSFDYNWQVIVKLPSSYYDSVCGLCGNFNGNPNDDMRDPAGNIVSSLITWSKSWRVPDPQNPNCWDTCKGDCPTCSGNIVKLYETEGSCGALTTSVNNYFLECHAKVDPQAFMNNCVYDMCATNGDRKMLCSALASYSNMCRLQGIILQGWREKFNCPMNCQPYSHYEACTSPCPLSCPFPAHQPTCEGICVEACVCNDGYVLSAGQCVLPETCGCSYQGHYVKPHERFWTEGCQQQCECDPDFHTVVCWYATCASNELCILEDGLRFCRPITYSTCTAAGDPHYHTFDGYYFNFQGTCTYQLVALCSNDPKLIPFTVTVQNNHRGSEVVAYTKVVNIDIYGITITISKDFPYKILVDGQVVSLPFYYDNNQLIVYRSGSMAVVEAGFGLRVTFDWNSLVQVTLPSTYWGAVCGLCGNYDGNPTDDRTMRGGGIASTDEKLGASWQVGQTVDCSSTCEGPLCQGCSTSQMEVYQAQRYCGIITQYYGPFWACRTYIDPKPYLEDCVFDACQYKGYHGVICTAVAAYAVACQKAGVNIQAWRSSTFCPPSCPKNSNYKLCSAGCPVTCANLPLATQCHMNCTEGCQCEEGYLLSGDACVPGIQCGCSFSGRYYKLGEVFYDAGQCQTKCQCGENGAVSCEVSPCSPGEACQLVKGVWGCYSTGNAKCVASGDPHYTTFDGRRFDFQGRCIYTLTKVCDNSTQLVPFAVEEENEPYGDGRVAVTRAVVLQVYGYIISIKQGMKWEVMVNKVRFHLPLFFDDGRITINQEGCNIIVQTDFGLKLLYDTQYYVEVDVPSSYKGSLCGLCGNYNGDSQDDFLLPNGQRTADVDVFGRAWVVNLPEVMCGGCGSQCPTCSIDKQALYGQLEFCGIINTTSGPFAACHAVVPPENYVSNCIFDLCTVDGNRTTLCNSVQAYAIACQSAGVQINGWRNISLCPLTCPANSHYELCADTCGMNCANLVLPSTCTPQCFEGCQCDPGFVSDGSSCVSMDSCGCIYEGQYLKVGQSVVNQLCNSKCVCQATGAVTCQALICPGGQVCEVRDGIQGCYVRQGICTVQQGAILTTFNGMEGYINHNGAFDVVSVCDKNLNNWFRIVVEMCSRTGFPAVSTVFVYYLDTAIVINRQQSTWVNGKETTLPARLTSGITITTVDELLIIQISADLQVSYSTSQEVKVTITGSLGSKLCGACGNYNGNSNDNISPLGGTISANISQAIDSWRAMDLSGCCV
nr:IgGFc-binding protein-like isoform X1 [Paramormyrops kingsleyae]